MRVDIYAEEMTDRIEIIEKEIDGRTFTALRFYLELPTTLPKGVYIEGPESLLRDAYVDSADKEDLDHEMEGGRNVHGPFIRRPGDDDSAAVTFWGKNDLRVTLRKALALLDEHYGKRSP